MISKTIVVLIVLGQASSLRNEICGEFGFNWAAEIRCLREMLDTCRQDRAGRSLEPMRMETGGQYHGYPTTNRRRTVMKFPEKCECSEEKLNNLSTRVDKQLYDVKMSTKYECEKLVEEVRRKAEQELVEFQRMMVQDMRDLRTAMEWIGARKVEHANHVYALIEKHESWYTAEEKCVGWGGHLASIHDRFENRVIAGLLKSDQMAWISINDVQRENKFVNTDGTVSAYRNWMNGQPDNMNHNENCALIDSKGEWNDALCLHARQFVCKKEL